MKLLYGFIPLLILILSSCTRTPSLTSSKPIIDIQTKIEFPTATAQPLFTQTPQVTAIPLATFTLEPKNNPTLFHSPTAAPPDGMMQFTQLQIVPTLPDSDKPSGTLLLSGEKHFLLHLDQNMRKDVLSMPNGGCRYTSPDGNWIACFAYSKQGNWLLVESFDRKQKKMMSIDKRSIEFDSHVWLDNQHLILPLYRERGEIHPMLVINPFTEEKVEIASDYPNFAFDPGVPSWLQFVYSNLVYDPSLNLVVYPMDEGDHHYIVLWDRQSQNILAKVEDLGPFNHYPHWSPDGKTFVVAVRFQKVDKTSNEAVAEDWVSVSREGKVERLTHLAEYIDDYGSIEIGNAAWSPDGQKLAFWIDIGQGECVGGNIAVLNMQTKQIIIFCVQKQVDAVTSFARPPVWSLDSQFIAAPSYFDQDQTYDTLLINPEKAWVTVIAEDAIPLGWLSDH